MPLHLQTLEKADKDGLCWITIVDSDLEKDDPSIQHQIRQFKKLKINYAVTSPQNTTKFAEWMTKLLSGNPVWEELDLSEIDLPVKSLLPLIKSAHSIRTLNLSNNNELINIVSEGKPTLRRAPMPFHRRRTQTKTNLPHDLLLAIASKADLEALIIRAIPLFKKHDDKVFEAILSIVRNGTILLIDARNTHLLLEHFTLRQLYRLVEDEQAAARGCQFLISPEELPVEIQQKLIGKIPLNAKVIDLFSIRDEIIRLYLEALFDNALDKIRSDAKAKKSEAPTQTASATYLRNFSCDTAVTDEQIKRLAEVLKVKGCKLQTLSLPPCNLALLEVSLQDNTSIICLDLSQLEATEMFFTTLARILEKNVGIRRLRLNSNVINHPNFEILLAAIAANNQSGLVRAEKRVSYIELVDVEHTLANDLKRFETIVDKLNCFKQPLTHINVVVDTEQVNYDLRCRLASQELLCWPENGMFSYVYEFDELYLRGLPVISVLSRDKREEKLILTPCYETHAKVIQGIKKYVAHNATANEEEVIQELAAELGNEVIEEALPDELGNESETPAQETNPVAAPLALAEEKFKDVLFRINTRLIDMTTGKEARDRAIKLHDALLSAGHDFFIAKIIDGEQFKQKCHRACAGEKPLLAENSSWSEIFANITSITRLCNTISRLVGNFGFFSREITAEEQELNTMDKELQGLTLN
ncbi:hypothetical protein [Legionella donaldsonii]|nr:hypothetical protein [Legionella donaldsonii]